MLLYEMDQVSVGILKVKKLYTRSRPEQVVLDIVNLNPFITQLFVSINNVGALKV